MHLSKEQCNAETFECFQASIVKIIEELPPPSFEQPRGRPPPGDKPPRRHKLATLRYRGHPKKGGSCILVIYATLVKLLNSVNVSENECGLHFDSNTVIETDRELKLVKEVAEESAALVQARPNIEQEIPWGLDRIDGLDSTYSAGASSGSGVHIYVLDSGILTTHTDFEHRAIPTLDFFPADGSEMQVCSASDTECATDRNGHGTHAAGTIAGKTYGVAKKATLHAVKIFSDEGASSVSTFSEAVDWVATYGESPKVISASLGAEGTSHTMTLVVEEAVKAGVTIVVAAGNDGSDACSYTPALIDAVITVGSTTHSDKISSFSNYGTCVDIFAPGSHITSTSIESTDSIAMKSGTSMACPHVVGVIARMLSKDPSLTPHAVRQLLLDTATKDVILGLPAQTPNKLLFASPDDSQTTCSDTNDGAVGAFGISCDDLNNFCTPTFSYDVFNDDDFVAADMCCACGGGSTKGA